MTDLLGNAAVEWIRSRKDRPYFLYLPFTAPHTPIQAEEDYDPQTRTAPHCPGHRPTYARMVERMDARIGDVLKGVDNNTIVIFHSDNGTDRNGRNDPFKGQRSSVWEGGIRSPLHIRWPGRIAPGTECAQVSLSMDLTPTLPAAAGAPTRKYDGIDLVPHITGGQTPTPRTVFWRYKRAQNIRKAIRHGDWKYIDDSGVKALLKHRLRPWRANRSGPAAHRYRAGPAAGARSMGEGSGSAAAARVPRETSGRRIASGDIRVQLAYLCLL